MSKTAVISSLKYAGDLMVQELLYNFKQMEPCATTDDMVQQFNSALSKELEKRDKKRSEA
jgi:hypothetical protein